MKKKNNIKYMLLAVLVIILCFVIGYFIGRFLYEKYAESKNLNPIILNELI